MGMVSAPITWIALTLPVASMGAVEQVDVDPGGSQPVGYLLAEVYTPAPVTVAQGGFVTVRLVNVAASPVRISIGLFDYQPAFAALYLPTKRGAVTAADVWGPELGERIDVPLEGITVPGFSYRWQAWWPDNRDGFILFKDEGYARRIVYHPNSLPKAALSLGPQILFNGPPGSVVAALPLPDPDAVQAGKPIRFAEAQGVFAPGVRAIEVAQDLPRGEQPRPAQIEQAQAPAPWLDLEAPRSLVLGEDVEITYLVGNRGPEPIWIWQDSLALHRFAWSILDRTEAVVAQGDGTALRAMADLAPIRPPQVLMPGEFLCVKTTILAGETKAVKPGADLRLRGSLSVRVAAGGRDPAPGEAVEVPLVAEFPIALQRRR